MFSFFFADSSSLVVALLWAMKFFNVNSVVALAVFYGCLLCPWRVEGEQKEDYGFPSPQKIFMLIYLHMVYYG